MKFINPGEDRKVRTGTRFNFTWISVGKGEIIDLPEAKGKRYGLKKVTGESEEKVTEGQIGDKKVETKQFEKKKDEPGHVEFYKKLIKIQGIGYKTAEDIINVFPTEQKLRFAISHDDELPFRDDIEEKLRRKYGK